MQSAGDTADGQEVWRSEKGEEKSKRKKMVSLFTFKYGKIRKPKDDKEKLSEYKEKEGIK